MAIKFQYNKTSLQQLEKQLKVRVRTLPIIKNKESALRMEVKRCKSEAAALDEKLEREKKMQKAMLDIKKKYGKNAILKGMNLQEDGTAMERNRQIEGHKA